LEIWLFVGTGNAETVKCFRATFGANPSFAVDKFAFLDSVPASPQKHLPVKLTIDKSFRENLKSSKTANSSSVSLPPRPSTPSQDYMTFAEELQKTCMSTPGNKFNDSGWASNSNSVSSFSTDTTLCGIDDTDDLLDVVTPQHSSPSFEGVTFTEPLFALLSDNAENESLSSEQGGRVPLVSVDDSVDSLYELGMMDLPSSWQALDGRLLPPAFDHFNDDVIAADINDMVSNESSEGNVALDYFPEVNELLAYVGE